MPQLRTCNGSIADRADVSDCLECIGETAIDQEIALTDGDLNDSNDRQMIVDCQRRIGKSIDLPNVNCGARQVCLLYTPRSDGARVRLRSASSLERVCNGVSSKVQ